MVHSDRFLFALLTVGLIGAAVAGEDEKPRSIKGWGEVIDTAGQCTVKGDEHRLTIEVPGGTHDLNPTLGGMRAPRVLKEVEGDFVIQVKVTGDFKPGEESASPDTSSFNGAGLLIWQDSKNFIRFERNAWWVRDAGAYACYPPLFEYHKDGQFQNTNPDGTRDDFFKGRSTWLKLERRADKLSASYSHDGKEWTEVKQIDVELPRKVQVGVAAVNTSAKPLAVEFEELSVRPR
jgi:regulation of enolase protein 1 (concanavalin A-like superfamily)